MERVKLKLARVELVPEQDPYLEGITNRIARRGEEQLSLDLEVGLSDWLTCEPWQDGWYEMKGGGPFHNKALVERAFYRGHNNEHLHGLWFALDKKNPGDIMSIGWHSDLMQKGYEWRGLARPPKIERRALL